MDYKKVVAAPSTVTRDTDKIGDVTGNVYESLVVTAKRANQIATEIKSELNSKLQEFASHTDNLEEIFENREQIEISKFYEKLPKPLAIALEELQKGEIYYRQPKANK